MSLGSGKVIDGKNGGTGWEGVNLVPDVLMLLSSLSDEGIY